MTHRREGRDTGFAGQIGVRVGIDGPRRYLGGEVIGGWESWGEAATDLHGDCA